MVGIFQSNWYVGFRVPGGWIGEIGFGSLDDLISPSVGKLVLRDLDGFDTLTEVLLGKDYRALRAALIPCAVVPERCRFV